MLSPTYDIALVLASIIVSIMASFTGLVLVRGIAALPDLERKFRIVMASLALGGGIWSMHFVAMLAMRLPVPVAYDAVYTLGSALIAVLMSGVAFLILNYIGRGPRLVVLAGAVLGNGIVAMHYLGMSGIRGCVPLFAPTGVALAVIAATLTGVFALHLAQEGKGRTLAAAVLFGLSVVLVHFIAMGWTGLRAAQDAGEVTPLIEHGTLALLVMLSAFVICGTFLLTASTALGRAVSAQVEGDLPQFPQEVLEEAHQTPVPEQGRLPYEKDRKTWFIEPAEVAAIRAEGHYSILYAGEEKLFCPLALSTVEKRLPAGTFMRTHRSYLVNIAKVAGFERTRDAGRCLLQDTNSLAAVPVSRSLVPRVREILGL